VLRDANRQIKVQKCSQLIFRVQGKPFSVIAVSIGNESYTLIEIPSSDYNLTFAR